MNFPTSSDVPVATIGDSYVRSLACTAQFRVMTFAQQTYCESLRDTETCLSAQSAEPYQMGLRQEIKRLHGVVQYAMIRIRRWSTALRRISMSVGSPGRIFLVEEGACRCACSVNWDGRDHSGRPEGDV